MLPLQRFGEKHAFGVIPAFRGGRSPSIGFRRLSPAHPDRSPGPRRLPPGGASAFPPTQGVSMKRSLAVVLPFLALAACSDEVTTPAVPATPPAAASQSAGKYIVVFKDAS